jgi:hypothetical protein
LDSTSVTLTAPVDTYHCQHYNSFGSAPDLGNFDNLLVVIVPESSTFLIVPGIAFLPCVSDFFTRWVSSKCQ